MSSQDWPGWSPRAPLCEGHYFAHAANLFWQVLGDYVDAFFRHNEQGIRQHWYEVLRFSQDLVTHATPFLADNNGDRYYDTSEIADPSSPRMAVAGIVKSVSPITESTQPDAVGMANLAQVCCYVIYHTTFWHSWCHNRQSPDGGDLRYATLGLRNGSWGPESDPAIAPTPADMIVQLFIANVLDGVRYGYLVKNEDNDVGSGLIAGLEAARQKFLAFGLNIDEIPFAHQYLMCSAKV